IPPPTATDTPAPTDAPAPPIIRCRGHTGNEFVFTRAPPGERPACPVGAMHTASATRSNGRSADASQQASSSRGVDVARTRYLSLSTHPWAATDRSRRPWPFLRPHSVPDSPPNWSYQGDQREESRALCAARLVSCHAISYGQQRPG